MTFFEKLKGYWHRRKKLNPIVSAIFVIVFTISFSAIIYFVVIPLIVQGELVVLDYTLEDTDHTNFVDKITINLENVGNEELAFTSVRVVRNSEVVNWSLGSTTYVVDQKEEITIICFANSSTNELAYSELVEFEFPFEVKFFSFEIKIPAIFSSNTIIFGEDFEDFENTNWTHHSIAIHDLFHNHNLSDWLTDKDEGNTFWQCTNNDCQFVILSNPLMNFTNANISCDLSTNGSDATGFIYRFDDSGTYPKFYILWYTQDHPSPRNGPHVEEIDLFDWDDPATDQILPGELTVHFVEGDPNGYNWHKIASVAWEREYNTWYTWRIDSNMDHFRIYIDNAETPILDFYDYRISRGQIGLVSLANDLAFFDNLYVW
ncbi:MAG: hypothetical protein KAX09_00040 [Candidatus Heimdallarchaeota archaeon]|nr:hypothetical protein [Candidatus Heimdallarchaeota archaeon]MCK4289344.1 hypothetical protein [Candidatus Heimdallarchaeota archaeon]